MTGLEQSRHMCDMLQGIFEAQAKLFERRGLGFEDETWSNGFQLDKVKVLFVKNREFNWLTAACLICRFLRAEKKGAMKALWLSCLLQIPWQKFIRRKVTKQSGMGNIGIIALCLGHISSSQHIFGDVN